MARITIEDCLKKVDNRFVLVNIIAKRVREMRNQADYWRKSSSKNEDVVTAMREIASGKVLVKDDETV
jgi:DNA-directed RNA polymerase subunit omega